MKKNLIQMLQKAIINNQLDLFRAHIEKPEIQEEHLAQLLCFAIKGKDLNGGNLLAATRLSVMESLCDVGVIEFINKSKSEFSSETVLEEAVSYGTQEILELLIKKGLSIDPSSDASKVLLEHAVLKGSTAIVELLLDKGFDKKIALQAAVGSGNIAIIKLLIDRELDVSQVLLRAVKLGNTSTVKLLLNAGADPNVDIKGQIPLFVAVKHAREKMLALLLKKEARCALANREGKYPIEYAVERYLDDPMRTPYIVSDAEKIAKLLILSGTPTFKKDENVDEDLLARAPELQSYRDSLYAKIRSILKKSFKMQEVPKDYECFILQVGRRSCILQTDFRVIQNNLEAASRKLYGDEDKNKAFKKVFIDKMGLYVQGYQVDGIKNSRLALKDAKVLSAKILLDPEAAERDASRYLAKRSVLPLDLLHTINEDSWRDYLTCYLEPVVSERCNHYLFQWVTDLRKWVTDLRKLELPLDVLGAWIHKYQSVRINAQANVVQSDSDSVDSEVFDSDFVDSDSEVSSASSESDRSRLRFN